MEPIATVAILAGGLSRRMGTDKSFVLLHGKPIIEHVLAQVMTLALPTILIANSIEKYARYGRLTYGDLMPDQGTLGGIYTAIYNSATAYTLCVACDMPFLNPALLTYLIQLRTDQDVVAPRIGKIPEPLHAVYSKRCLAPIRAQLERGERKASGFYEQVRVRYVDESEIKRFDPNLRSFVNLNTPADLKAAQESA
jgi:molybdopterin-guanine dinucleotide biosynthesis protein A